MHITAKHLTALLGDDLVLHGDQIPSSCITDWSETVGAKPCAVVRPRTTEDVQKTLRFCNTHKIPVVPQGGLTGLVGAATVTNAQSVVISLERMNQIEHIDEFGAVIQAQAGVTLEAANIAANAYGLMPGVDFGARGSCQLGGAVATNAGGNGVVQHGMMREQVLGLEVVLADGTLLPMLRPMIKNNTGYDLKQLFIGSEGTLGIITRVMLRLRPVPLNRITALVALPDYDHALRLLSSLHANFSGHIAAFELMWQNFWECSLKYQKLSNPFKQSYPLYALLDLDGQNNEALQAQAEQFMEVAFEQDLLLDGVMTQSQAHDLWKIREATAEFYTHMQPPINFDVSVPIPSIGEFVQACIQAIAQRWPAHTTVCFGHVGDGNVHISTDGQTVDGDEQGIEQLVYAIVGRFGGSVSAEHGIGLHKKPYLHISRTPEELVIMQQLKHTLDPENIMNPGKVL